MKTIRQFPGWFSRQKLSGKLAIGCASLVIIFCLCSLPIAVFSPSTPTPESIDISNIQTVAFETALAVINQTATSNAPTNTATTIQTMTPSPTSIDTTLSVGKIQGITPTDVQIRIESQDFDCELVYAAITTDPYYKWECRKDNLSYLMLVEIWSTSIETVDLVRASIVQYETPINSLAIEFFGYVANLPYDGSDPQQARIWIETILPTIIAAGDIRETEIGGVSIRLYGIPSARSMQIGDDLPFP